MSGSPAHTQVPSVLCTPAVPLINVKLVTWVVEEGYSVSWGRAWGRDEKFSRVVRGSAAEEPCLGDHAPLFTGLNVA